MNDSIRLECDRGRFYLYGVHELEDIPGVFGGEDMLFFFGPDGSHDMYVANILTGKIRQLSTSDGCLLVSDEEIDYDSISQECECGFAGAKKKIVRYAGVNRWSDFKGGICAISWMLYPAGQYFADSDGFGMDDNDEEVVYAIMNTDLEIVEPFRPVDDVKKYLDEMRMKHCFGNINSNDNEYSLMKKHKWTLMMKLREYLYVKWQVWRGKAIDICNKSTYPANVLSNLYANKFYFEGVKCGSMEGFLQSLKCQGSCYQEETCALSGQEAKNKTNNDWQHDQIVWWRGRAIDRQSKDFRNLIRSAYIALYQQNEEFRIALSSTKRLKLYHSRGEHDPYKTILTENEFCNILAYLRDTDTLNPDEPSVSSYKHFEILDPDPSKFRLEQRIKEFIDGKCQDVVLRGDDVDVSFYLRDMNAPNVTIFCDRLLNDSTLPEGYFLLMIDDIDCLAVLNIEEQSSGFKILHKWKYGERQWILVMEAARCYITETLKIPHNYFDGFVWHNERFRQESVYLQNPLYPNRFIPTYDVRRSRFQNEFILNFTIFDEFYLEVYYFPIKEGKPACLFRKCFCYK